MGDIKNVQIGAQKLTYNGEDLGHTNGGCTFGYEPEFADIVVDMYGTTAADKALIGEIVRVTVPMAEVTVDKFKNAIPSGTFVEDSASGKKKLQIGSQAGKKMSDVAAELIMHPSWLPESDKQFDITLHKAIAASEVELEYSKDEQAVYEVEFVAIIDESKEDGNLLATIGDPETTSGDTSTST
ncbi:hypothetical protein CHL76_02215 [Marinococcus halophilus]|uniref:Uncharacterized protein n=1 Tax=Marinococcus halophilus TaxID=1371 RepID=A0A510Y1G2_MARHA|nr:hypothetical protein [Marinococcus halophilus]OZT81191.1 hypothetical protein CHL76_02215 [Marinococcus halophilus]GEK57124.1 hypothetical protein MHA01_00290 [Marinococcus halophilus]